MNQVMGEPSFEPKDPSGPDPTLPAHAWDEFETSLRLHDDGADSFGPPEWALVVYAGANLGRVFPLHPGDNIIGRSPQADVTILDDEVSRMHARVKMEQGASKLYMHLEDLESTNGTFLNGQPVLRIRPLVSGDRIALGTHVLKVVALDALERSFHQTLLDQSTKDNLTGLGNRGLTLAELQSRFELSRRHGRLLCVIMCDLDHFKQVNDTYGHGAGDFVLRTFGERLRLTLRSADVAGRIGGEEFLMVLPETDQAGAMLLAERIRAIIGEDPMVIPDGELAITCSLGVAEIAPADRDAGVLLARADGALYEAKHNGRNRVHFAPAT